jgi:gliding motility-associated-like protein
VIVEDHIAPTFQNCSADIVAHVQSTCSATVNWKPPVATDNCELTNIETTHNPGDVFPVGVTEVTYTAKDKSGNFTTCKFKVIVKNEMLPVFSNCPVDIHLEADIDGNATANWDVPTASTLCGQITMIASHSPGESFQVGTTHVEYKAIDEIGNTSVCSFKVTVMEKQIEIDAAKIITPDGNGINDEWIITNIEDFKNNKISIVDRWGGLIFTADGYDNHKTVWRGTNRMGELTPTGTYFYTISVRFGEKNIQKTGFIELVR